MIGNFTNIIWKIEELKLTRLKKIRIKTYLLAKSYTTFNFTWTRIRWLVMGNRPTSLHIRVKSCYKKAMRSNKAEPADFGFLYLGSVAVRMPTAMATPRGWCNVCPLYLKPLCFTRELHITEQRPGRTGSKCHASYITERDIHTCNMLNIDTVVTGYNRNTLIPSAVYWNDRLYVSILSFFLSTLLTDRRQHRTKGAWNVRASHRSRE